MAMKRRNHSNDEKEENKAASNATTMQYQTKSFQHFGAKLFVLGCAVLLFSLRTNYFYRTILLSSSVSLSTPQEQSILEKEQNEVVVPTTIFFGTHHKTGTALAHRVAQLLENNGLVVYSPPNQLTDRSLRKNSLGEVLKCRGSIQRPEIRRYPRWSAWMNKIVWPKWKNKIFAECGSTWWKRWPNTTNELLEKCMTNSMETLKNEIRNASCNNDYLVVNFVRDPVDLILSSYRYTMVAEEQWMQNNVSDHPLFKMEYCGDYYDSCQNGMTIQQAVRDLPMELGLAMDMNLISWEVIKKMIMTSYFATLIDPENHITVRLDQIMESSDNFNKTWNTILKRMFPLKLTSDMNMLLDMVSRECDIMNHQHNKDPSTKQKRIHVTTGKVNKSVIEQHKKMALADERVQFMLNDPFVKRFFLEDDGNDLILKKKKKNVIVM